MIEKQQPHVSCIMPTYNRREFVPHAIRYFLAQDYENKELIVIDDGSDNVRDLVPAVQEIRYYRLDQKITLGAKLNLGCSYAKGEIIANWDDDDWYARGRLSYQVNSLQNEGTDVCGINHLLYYDFRRKLGYRYIYPPDQRTWLLGSSLCYTRELWSRNHFADINVGMDGLFVWATTPDRITVLGDSTFAVHLIHDNNVSPKKTEGEWWHPYPVEVIKQIMQSDWHYYSNGTVLPPGNIPAPEFGKIAAHGHQQAPFKNIYACLVHENEDCIADLVNNLHYHDPASIILLYNGSGNPDLLQQYSSFGGFSVVCHPKPNPVKHGYLHSFAIDCMEFALENFAFDCFTIVDSDQLAIRSGYTGYLADFFSAPSTTGMLSSNPERVTRDSYINRVAIQAFGEYDLWQPLIRSFENGEDSFVHWTFWPSTVFTSVACRDLVKLFRENKQLQSIMELTRIWASEEVILPTLVKLLGYEIELNPCSYDFVKYQQKHTIPDIEKALSKQDAYWVHPVERVYNAPLRKYIRELFNNYSYGNKKDSNEHHAPVEIFFKSSLLDKINKIEGWLSDREADQLIEITIKACEELSPPHSIVEIGSYHGKSTVLFGTVVQQLFPGSKIYAIDTHDGKLGAADQGLQSFPPSFENFKRNIEDAGLAGLIEIIRDKSYNVKWAKPVSLLFIDGLHDYLNVSRDFWHFSHWIRPGGFVAFHDYARYFPGVLKFVDELLGKGGYKEIKKVDSLAILQKEL